MIEDILPYMNVDSEEIQSVVFEIYESGQIDDYSIHICNVPTFEICGVTGNRLIEMILYIPNIDICIRSCKELINAHSNTEVFNNMDIIKLTQYILDIRDSIGDKQLYPVLSCGDVYICIRRDDEE